MKNLKFYSKNMTAELEVSTRVITTSRLDVFLFQIQ